MNPNTGEIRRFESAREARQAGFTIPVGGSPFDQAGQARQPRTPGPTLAEAVGMIDRAELEQTLLAENRSRAVKSARPMPVPGGGVAFDDDGQTHRVTRQQRRRAERGLVKELMRAV